MREVDVAIVGAGVGGLGLGARLQSSVFGQGCTSWCKTRSGRVTTNWPGTATEYWRTARRPAPADFVFSTAAAGRA